MQTVVMAGQTAELSLFFFFFMALFMAGAGLTFIGLYLFSPSFREQFKRNQ